MTSNLDFGSSGILFFPTESFLLFIKIYFIHLKSRITERDRRDREKKVFHLLVYFSNGCNQRDGWARLKPRASSFFQVCRMYAGAQAIGTSSAAFPLSQVPSARSRIGSRAVET